ncbi:MAG: tetratricopeptide repeat protein [Alphaproteobacteria bacterium]|nr:tetratricopeptide repeat protein [Alphaproteobacteria bacterium]
MTKEPKKTTKKQPAAKKIAVKKQTPEKAPVLKTEAYDEAAADAFIMEVDEEVKNDNLKAFWKKYGLFVTLCMVLVLSATVSYETIKNWRENQFRAKTDAYISANFAPTNADSLAALEKIAASNNGIYSELARIQIADLLLEEGKKEDGLTMLQTLATNDELNPRIRNLAAIKLAARTVDTAPRAEIESLLAPVVSADDSWSPIAQDFLALAALKDGDLETARTIYQNLLQDGRLSEQFKGRIQDMLTTISD